jgi:tRNA (adenine57-N1/adenine58-N1)-methyltransferase
MDTAADDPTPEPAADDTGADVVATDPDGQVEVEVDTKAEADGETDAVVDVQADDVLAGLPDRSFRAGEQILLIDRKKRRYLVTLEPGGEFHTHAGFVPHDNIIGAPEGAILRSTKGANFTGFRPTLSDFVLKMPRGAQVIYPKDLGPILMLADIFPGARVLESGVGSGALSMTLLRAGAHVTGYEIRDDFARRAVKNVKAFGGEELAEHYRVEVRDIYEGIDEVQVDRIVLDLPEPWQVVPHAETALRPGGILVAYTPAITQAVQLRERLVDSGFELAETMEVLHRGWNIDGMSVRPDHRMVAHTGFLTHARLLPTPDR